MTPETWPLALTMRKEIINELKEGGRQWEEVWKPDFNWLKSETEVVCVHIYLLKFNYKRRRLRRYGEKKKKRKMAQTRSFQPIDRMKQWNKTSWRCWRKRIIGGKRAQRRQKRTLTFEGRGENARMGVHAEASKGVAS